MEFRKHSLLRCAPRGGAAVVFLNLVVLLLIAGLGGGYYFVQMRPQRAVAEFAKAQELEKKGHLSSAELAYQKAVRLDPGNVRYQRSLDAVLRGEGNLREMEAEEVAQLAASSEDARTASAALWPKEARVSSTPSLARMEASKLAGIKKLTEEEVAMAMEAPLVNTETLGSGLGPLPVERRKFDLEVIAPRGAEYEVKAANVDDEVPGRVLQSWMPVTNRWQREVSIGEYELSIRMPSGEGFVEAFKVTKNGGVLQSLVREYGLVRIDGKPEKASVYDVDLKEQVGVTPFAVVRRAGPVGFVLKCEGHEDSSIEGEVEAGGILHFNHHLAKIVPPPPPPKPELDPATVAREKELAADQRRKELARIAELEKELAEAEAMIVRGREEERRAAAAAAAAPVTPPVTSRVVEVKKPDPLPEPEPELGWEPIFGQSFIGPEGVAYSYGEKSVRGDPFWMSKSAPLVGKSQAGAEDYCANLTARERAAGRVPAGYGYHPSLSGDGKIALCVEYVRRQDGRVVRAEAVPRAAVVAQAEVINDTRSSVVTQEYRAQVARSDALRFGESFRTLSGLWMEFGKADSYGNPFWLSAETPVAGMTLQQMSQYCWDLTESERAAGRLPAGYRYVATKGTGGKVLLGKTQ